MKKISAVPFIVLLGIQVPLVARAEIPEFLLEIRDHLFSPDQLKVPAATKFRLRIINHDAAPEEFESYPLNREKVIAGNSQTVIFIGPLAPGEYPFFGEFNPATAVGTLIAE